MVILFSASNQALAYKEFDILIIWNKTGRDIYFLYLSPSGQESWGRDRLNKEVLQDESSTVCDVPQNRYWDLKIVFEDGDSYTWRQIDIDHKVSVTIVPYGAGYRIKQI